MNIGLVTCTKTKLAYVCPARRLYSASTGFQRHWRLAQQYDVRYIVSAKFGLLDPEAMVGPYDQWLGSYSADDQLVWGHAIAADLAALGFGSDDVFYAHVSGWYFKPLAAAFQRKGWVLVHVPY